MPLDLPAQLMSSLVVEATQVHGSAPHSAWEVLLFSGQAWSKLLCTRLHGQPGQCIFHSEHRFRLIQNAMRQALLSILAMTMKLQLAGGRHIARDCADCLFWRAWV